MTPLKKKYTKIKNASIIINQVILDVTVDNPNKRIVKLDISISRRCIDNRNSMKAPY